MIPSHNKISTIVPQTNILLVKRREEIQIRAIDNSAAKNRRRVPLDQIFAVRTDDFKRIHFARSRQNFASMRINGTDERPLGFFNGKAVLDFFLRVARHGLDAGVELLEASQRAHVENSDGAFAAEAGEVGLGLVEADGEARAAAGAFEFRQGLDDEGRPEQGVALGLGARREQAVLLVDVDVDDSMAMADARSVTVVERCC